jgi:hypothetical protein
MKMKKLLFCIIASLISVIACASSSTNTIPPPVVTDNHSPEMDVDAVKESPNAEVTLADWESSAMDLDAAIKAAALKMGTNLPAKIEVALVSLASTSAQLSEYILSRLEAALVDDGKLIVLDRANLDRIREEQGFQLSGDVDDKSAKEIGKMLGAGAIVTGSLINLGDVYGLSLKAINMKTAAIAVSYPADITKSTRIETLLASGGGSAGTGTRTTQTPRDSGKTTTISPQVTAPATQAPEVPKSYKVGDKGPAGGIVFYDKGIFFNGWQYLEAAPGDINPAKWGSGVGSTGTVVGAGKQNTQLIAEHAEDGGAAKLCATFEFGGYNDWFLPSQDELDLMYKNLKQKGLGSFLNSWYWSSSDTGTYSTYCQNFSNGEKSSANFYNMHSVRPIRQF